METSPEFDFLLDCLKVNDKFDIDDFHVGNNINWKKWIDLLLSHGVLIQVYRKIKEIKSRGTDLLPADILKYLKGIYYFNTVRNIKLCRELNSLIKSMQASSIRVITFKGPVLAVQAYNDYATRSYQDLDFLVNKHDFSKFYDTMEEIGYQSFFPFNKRIRKWWARLGREFLFYKENVLIDVHFRIQRGPKFFRSETRLLSDCSEIDILDHPIKTLSIEYSILSVCINGTKDGWYKLSYVSDLANLIQNNSNLNWDFVVSTAKKMKVYTMFCIGLRLCNKFLGLEIPEEINRNDIEKKRIYRLAEIYSNALIIGEYKSGNFSNVWIEIKSVDTLWGRTRYFLYYLFVPKISDLKEVTFLGYFLPLYLFIRPLLLLIRMIRVKLFVRNMGKERVVG